MSGAHHHDHDQEREQSAPHDRLLAHAPSVLEVFALSTSFPTHGHRCSKGGAARPRATT